MIIYPAIDIMDGKCVRLKQGKFDDVTVFNEDPSAQAVIWKDMGASYIHVVDLDGARHGSGYNDKTIERIIAAAGVPVQVGGGIRTIADIVTKLDMGVARVILGTAAVTNTDLVETALKRFGPERIVVGIDAKDGFAAVSGWEDSTKQTALECCLNVKQLGVKTVIYTDISKDGMMQGPSVESTAKLFNETKLDIIASGGVSSMDDLRKIYEIGVSGVIVGKALFTGDIDLLIATETFDVS